MGGDFTSDGVGKGAGGISPELLSCAVLGLLMDGNAGGGNGVEKNGSIITEGTKVAVVLGDEIMERTSISFSKGAGFGDAEQERGFIKPVGAVPIDCK